MEEKSMGFGRKLFSFCNFLKETCNNSVFVYIDFSAAGTLGRPGIVMMSPVIATINPAPLESFISLTVMTNPCGLPKRVDRRKGSTVSWLHIWAACPF